MWKDVSTNMDTYFDLPNPSLRGMLDRIAIGNDEEYRTPFYEGKDLHKILDDWISHLENLKTEWPGLYKFEIDLSKKVGPLSIMKPLKDRMEDVDSYYDSILLESEPVSDDAIRRCQAEWSKARGLRIRGQQTTVEVMKKSTNSGSPYYRKKRDVITKTIPCSVTCQLKELPTVKQVLPTGEWNACAVLGWRGQEGGPSADDVKQRSVWMFPFAVNIRELQLYQPLIESAQKFNLVPAWVGMEAVDYRITQLFDTKSPKDLIVCTDFTKFDQHFGSSLQSAAQIMLKYLLTADASSSEWLENVFPIKYNIPLCYEWGSLRMGPHGMGSGSGGTNADETLAHRCLQHEAALRKGRILNPNSMCLGDDGILTFPGITAKDVMDSYVKHGLDMNLDKQEESTLECTYLRRWHHMNYRIEGICVGVYSTCRALGRLAEQERYYNDWSKEMVALRQLSILENCKYHPLRDEFLGYCMKGDKYRLGLDIPNFIDNLGKWVDKAISNMPDFMGYTRSLGANAMRDVRNGINSWWVVQKLKSMR